MVDLTLSESVAQGQKIGSNNAAYVPCMLYDHLAQNGVLWNTGGASIYRNLGANDFTVVALLPLPTVKNNLDLFVSGTRISINDADAGDFVDRVYVLGFNSAGSTTIDDTGAGVGYNTAADHDDSWTPVDCSSYTQIMIYVNNTVTNATDLDVAALMIQCYYDYA